MGVDQDFTIELTEDEFSANGTLLKLGLNKIHWRGRDRTFDIRTILNPVNGLCHVIFPVDAVSGEECIKDRNYVGKKAIWELSKLRM